MTRARDVADTQENNGGGVAPFTAGKNKIINGDFGVWQRGTSFSNPTTEAYTADRWQLQHDGSGATRTISQQTFTPGTAPVTGYEGQYFYRYAVSAAGTSNTFQQFLQKVEDIRTFAGQTVTLSFWAKADASRVLTLLYRTDYGTGGSSANQFTVGSVTLTTSWTRYTVTYAVPSVSGLTIGTSSYGQWNFRPPAATVQTIDIWGVQLEAGNVATPFTTATGTVQGELAACQRYLPAVNYGNSVAEVGNGFCISTTQGFIQIPFAVQPRVAPTGATISSASHFQVRQATGATQVPTGIAFNNASLIMGSVLTSGNSGLVQGNGTSFQINSSSGSILFTGCEL